MLEPLIEQYLTQLRVHKRLAVRTINIYADALFALKVQCEEHQLLVPQVERVHIRHWIASDHSKGLSPRTLAQRLSGWRGFFKWLVLEGRMAHNPCQDIKPPKLSRPLPKALSVDAAMQLANFVQSQKANALHEPWLLARDKLIVELLYGCGLRVSELSGLNMQADRQTIESERGWVDLESQEVHVFGKGGKRRMVPLGESAYSAYKAYMLARLRLATDNPQEQALLLGPRGTRITANTIWQLLRKRSLAAGLNVPVHPHMLRHSFASHVLQSSHDLRAVQELLGHSSIASTQVYTKLDFQHLAQIYDNTHPRAKITKETE